MQGIRVLTISIVAAAIGLVFLGYPNHESRGPASLPAQPPRISLSQPFLNALGACANTQVYIAAISARGNGPDHVVNGHKLLEVEQANVEFIRNCVFPLLPGELSNRVDMAAKATWWALREGILELPLESMAPEERRLAPKNLRGLPSSLRYSSCHNARRHRDELHSDDAGFVCPSQIWQVGLAAAQVDTFSNDLIDNLGRSSALRISPSGSLRDLLGWTANLSGFPQGSAGYETIVSSTGRLRKSWLMRNPLVAFSPVQAQEVDAECLRPRHPKHWCTTHGYPAANRYGKTKGGMLQSISDLRRVFAGGRDELVVPAPTVDSDDNLELPAFPNAGEIPDRDPTEPSNDQDEDDAPISGVRSLGTRMSDPSTSGDVMKLDHGSAVHGPARPTARRRSIH